MEQTFVLPRSSTGTPVLEVQVGPLAPGQRVRVTTATGVLIGAISPFGAAARQHAGVYSLPVPPEAIRDGRLDTRVTIEEGNKAPRAPSAAELLGVKLAAPDPSR